MHLPRPLAASCARCLQEKAEEDEFRESIKSPTGKPPSAINEISHALHTPMEYPTTCSADRRGSLSPAGSASGRRVSSGQSGGRGQLATAAVAQAELSDPAVSV